MDPIIKFLEMMREELQTHSMDNAKALMSGRFGSSSADEGRARALAVLYLDEFIYVRMLELKSQERTFELEGKLES